MDSHMRKTLFVISISIILLFSVTLVSAHGEGKNFTEGQQLVESKASCENLTENQLEEIGEYLMEQMHPGEAHEQMHTMMGLQEGSETEKQFHINMAKTMYCNESGMMGMMPMMNMMSNEGMMGRNSLQTGNLVYSTLSNILIIVLIFLVVLGIVKLSKDILKK